MFKLTNNTHFYQNLLFSDQELLFQEFMDWTHPSYNMNKVVFTKYLEGKGGKVDNIDHLFRYVHSL